MGFLQHANRRTGGVLCIALATTGLSWTPGSFAETAAPDRERASMAIEEVIVTARKAEESAQSVPIAITALSREMTSPTIRNLTDLNGYAPNVQIGEDGSRSGGGASITIRGISPTRTDDNSFDSPIGVMIDGIYLGSLAGQVLENFDIERVEILRGPQGTLFGKNTVGGVVHVIRSRPTGEWGARAKATLGDDSQRELRLVVNAPLLDGKLAAKGFFTMQKDDGFMSNVTTGSDVANADYQNYGATFLLTPVDAFEALFTIERFKDEGRLNAYHTNYNVAPGVIPPPTDPNETDYSGGMLNCLINSQVCRTSLATPKRSENDTDNDAKLDVDAYTLNMSFDLSDNVRLVSVTGYRDMNEYRIFDFDGSSAPFITIERWNDYDQFSQEFRVDGTWQDVSLTAGVYYWNSEFEQDWVTGGQFWSVLFGPVAADPFLWGLCMNQLPGTAIWCDSGIPNGIPLGDVITQVLYEQQETTSIAAFFQTDWSFAENWTLTAGVRWTEERKDFIAGQAYLSNVARQRLRNFPEYADLDQTWREVSPKLGVTHRLNDRSIVYASYSEGFHSGGFFGVNQNTDDFIRDQYDPEFAKSYELGYKSTLLDDRLRLNIAAFYTKFEDKQEQSIQFDPTTQTVATVFDNVANATYQGIEVEMQYVFSSYFRGFLNYGYLDAEYDKFETDINASDGVEIIEDASFLKPRNAPESTVGVGGTFSWPIAGGSLEVFGKYAWVDDIETNLLNTPLGRVKAIENVTASVGYFTEKWSISAYGRNLTDERFETIVPIADLFAVGSVNRPRSYGIEFEYEF
jgi:iron complex outermembrane recepter protein